ncbi:copper resistance protein CopC [Thermopolyspora sp. NPDC052614]|uniref:copper resistance CopC family protein n=1 Tax=Thermopolyspora sp. NPDC052614 TaxID=3155682 RepID=UPI0034273182
MRTSSFAAVSAGALAVLVSVLLGTVLAAPALAHTTLKRSDPAKNAKVEKLERVELEFTEQVRLPTVIVRGPGGKNVHDGKAKADGRIVTQDVVDDLPAGKYTIAYRVVSADGHPVEGEIPFTVVAPEPAESESATPDATDSPDATASADTTSSPDASAVGAAGAPSTAPPASTAATLALTEEQKGGVPVWLWIVVFGLAGVGIGLAISLRPKKTGDKTPEDAKTTGEQ